MGIIKTIKSKRSFKKNEVEAMGPGEGIPPEAIPDNAKGAKNGS